MVSNIVSDISPKSISMLYTPPLESRDLPFYILAWGHFYVGEKYYVEREGMEDFLLIYTSSGEGILTYAGKTLEVKEGQAFVLNMAEYHCYRTVPLNQWEILWFRFNGTAAGKYVQLINGDAYNLITPVDTKDILEIFNQIPEMIGKSMIHYVQISMMTTNILTRLLLEKQFVGEERFPSNQRMSVQVMEYMDKHYNRPIHVNEISKVFHMNVYHISRMFKKQTGTTPYAYLTRVRINRSKHLLQNTDFPINQIAEEVGFGNVNNYIRSFKIFTGTTPLRFRRNKM